MKFAFIAAFAFAILTASASAQTLERGNGADPVTLDPQRATSAAEANILRDLYEGLFTYDAAGRLIPGVAESWTVSDDLLTYTFAISPDAVWSNGTAVTAADFVLAFRRLFDPAIGAPDAHLFSGIRGAAAVLAGDTGPETIGVSALAARTLSIELTRPDPTFIHLLARPSAMPIHRNFPNVRQMPLVTQPFNGAYRFDGHEPGEGLWLIRNDRYSDAADVAFASVVYRGYDPPRALSAFTDGTLAVSAGAPLFALAGLAEELGEAFREVAFSGTFFLAANVAGVLANANLRRAVALAVDRVALADETWFGAMIPTLALLPPGLADQREPVTAALGPNVPDNRRAEARELLAAAGYGPGNPLTLVIAVSDSDLQRATADAIIRDLAVVGIAATVVIRPVAEHHIDLTGDRGFDLAPIGWIGETGHAAGFLSLFEADNPGNVTGYAGTAFAMWMDEARVTTDRTVRTALYAAAERELLRDLPAIPVMHYASFNLVSPLIDGWEGNALDVHLSRWLSLRPAGE